MFRLALILALLFPVSAAAAPWSVVTDETRVEVDAPYLGRVVTMRFPRLGGTVTFDAQRPQTAKADILVDATAVSTGAGFIDAVVRSADFLNTARHPRIRFRLTELVKTSDSTADIYGEMTLLGVTRPALFRAQVFRFGPGSDGRFEAGFDLTGAVDRRTFGHTSGQPQLAPVFPVRIRLLLREQ